MAAAQNAWFEYFVKGQGSEPEGARGGVVAISSHCPATAASSGTEYKAANWASLAPGEINLQGAAEQTIEAPGIAPKTAFTSGTVCTTEAAGENASAATYKLAPAPSEGFTIAGSTTVIGEFSTPITNDQVIARLMDVAENGEQQLVGRAIYRPINPERGFTKQVFQLHPQLWNVVAGHVLKLQLLISDSGYARNSSSATSSAASIKVRSLELRVPTIQTPGSDGGLIAKPLAKYLPPDYTLSRNVTPAAPSAPQLSSGATPNASGVFTLAWEATQAASVSTYTLQQKDADGGWETVASGLTSPEYAFTNGGPEAEGTWTFRVSTSNESPESEFSSASSEVKVDRTAPNAPAANASREPDYAGGGGWYKGSVEVSFSSNGDPNLADGSAGSGVNPFSFVTTASPQTFDTSGTHTACGTVEDNVGNVSQPGCLSVQVDATAPTLEISCPEMVAIGSSASATYSASDAYSGLASPASGTIPINTSTAGTKTVSTTAVSNVGYETTKSCSTMVGYYVVVSGPVNGTLIVRSGEAIELTSTAKVSGSVKVKAGGALDVEGASIGGSLTSGGAALIRMCGATVHGHATVNGSSGSVVIGESSGCASNTVSGKLAVAGNTAGVTIVGNTLGSAVKVTGNSGGTTVTANKVAGKLTVTGNSGSVIDSGNQVKGKSKLQ